MSTESLWNYFLFRDYLSVSPQSINTSVSSPYSKLRIQPVPAQSNMIPFLILRLLIYVSISFSFFCVFKVQSIFCNIFCYLVITLPLYLGSNYPRRKSIVSYIQCVWRLRLERGGSGRQRIVLCLSVSEF